MPDRQFEAVLERLDRIAAELARLNRHAENAEGFQLMARELRNLNESLNALAYAALGQSPRVRSASEVCTATWRALRRQAVNRAAVRDPVELAGVVLAE